MHDKFVNDKVFDAVLQDGLRDPRIALRPVIAAAGDQPHAAGESFPNG